MFKVGDRVLTETEDELNGLFGTVTRLSAWQEGCSVLLDEDAEEMYDLSMFFDYSELRKVDA